MINYVVGQTIFTIITPFIAPLVAVCIALTATLYIYSKLKTLMRF